MGCDLTEINQKVEGIWDSSLMWRKILAEISVTTVEPWVKTYCVPSIFMKGKWVLFQLERWDPSDIKVVAIDKIGLRIPTQPPPHFPICVIPLRLTQIPQSPSLSCWVPWAFYILVLRAYGSLKRCDWDLAGESTSLFLLIIASSSEQRGNHR